MQRNRFFHRLIATQSHLPTAVAVMRGSRHYPEIEGLVKFYRTAYGTLVVTELVGLPVSTHACESAVFALHIHGGARCAGNATDPFADAGTHYDPFDCPHPYHAGDLPPVFAANGAAYSVVLTDRFTVDEVLGRTVILHDSPDDFMTQPAGNAGARIACGEITLVRR